MPTTASPAPRSKSVSVSDGTSETTRDGGVGEIEGASEKIFHREHQKHRLECLCHINSL